jgi:hypothetical protein
MRVSMDAREKSAVADSSIGRLEVTTLRWSIRQWARICR